MYYDKKPVCVLRLCVAAVHSAILRPQSTHQSTAHTVEVTHIVIICDSMFTSVTHCHACTQLTEKLSKKREELEEMERYVPYIPVLPNTYSSSTVNQCTLTWPLFQAPPQLLSSTVRMSVSVCNNCC